MAWETGHYCHPQGAILTRVMLTWWLPLEEESSAMVWYRERDDPSVSARPLAEITMGVGKTAAFVSQGLGVAMAPMESRVWLASSGDSPPGLMAAVGFNRKP